MSAVDVYISLQGIDYRVGTLYRQSARDREAVTFEYDVDWLNSDQRFSLEPALATGSGIFHPGAGREMFGSIGDSAPDTWGRQLMQRAERRQAAAEGRRTRTLHETDYLLGVSDISRLGALRFKRPGDTEYQAPVDDGVPGFVSLPKLLGSVERIERGEETDEDFAMIIAPGSSLGGARPKTSVIDTDGNLAIAKFPKESDDYSVEAWEHIALEIADIAKIEVPRHELVNINEKAVLISWRFDREARIRIPFLSALSMLQLSDGDRASYPEIVDELSQHGARTKRDSEQLYRRMVFNILVSNVDDHLRNHGFLWAGKGGWLLSPAYDLNPVPEDLKARILRTNISLDDATCSLELAEEQAEFFGLSREKADRVIGEVANAVAKWRDIAAQEGESRTAIERMASAFEHKDLQRALVKCK